MCRNLIPLEWRGNRDDKIEEIYSVRACVRALG